jgi:phenylacetate-coenzyme A ligase PaaK-like adenylate-forming protein
MHKKQIRPLARLHGYWLHRRLLPQMQAWPREQRSTWVFEKLKRTLVLAGGGIPFYRERFRQAGFDPARDFKSVADLARVPVLTKDDVRANFEQMIDRRFLRGSVEAHTSGTTGQPMTMRLNEWYIAFDYACMFRHWAKAGYTFRAPYAAVRSYVPDTPGDPLWKFSWWQNTLYMSAYHLKPANGEQYIEALLRFRPQFIRGYVSSINVLAEFAFPHREKFGFVRGVFTASETLSDFERAHIERTFGSKLYDWYGMTEPAVVITERADHDGMEVDWEYGYPEFAEAPGLSSAERRLIATSLHNPVMPFIRYETEDMASLADGLDSAGLYPKIRAMRGRKDECLVTPDGARLPSLNFYSLLQTYTDILRFQFVQTSANSVTMRISLRPGTPKVEALVFALRGEVCKRLGPDLTLEIEVTDQFLTSPDGKSPTFKRLIRPSTPAAGVRESTLTTR